MGEEILLVKDAKRISAARIYLFLSRPIVKAFFLTFTAAGFLAAVVYFSDLTLPLPGIKLYLAALILFGFKNLASYVFVFHYLAGIFKPRTLDASENYFLFFDPEVTKIIGSANLENPDLGRIFEALLKSPRVIFVLNEGQVNQKALEILFTGMPKSVSSFLILKNVLVDAFSLALKEGRGAITTADIFYGFLAISKNAEKFLLNLEINSEDFENIIFWSNRFYEKIDYPKTLTETLSAISPGIGSSWAAGYTNHLDRFSFAVGKVSGFSAEGRSELITKMEDTLSKESKNNCILVGPLGVGKTSLVYALAEKIYWGKTISSLCHYRVLVLDTASIISASSRKGDIERILSVCLSEAEKAGNVILFIDEIQNIFSGGKEGTIDASEIISPYLESRSLKIIGATTESAFETYIAPKSSVAGNFEKIKVGPTTPQATIKILEDASLYKAAQYGVRVTYFALKKICEMSKRIPGSKEFPARAVDLMEEVFSGARNAGVKVADHETVFKLLERNLGVPVAEAKNDEKKNLLSLEEKIHERIIGQEEAVKAVAGALKRARTKGLNGERPIGTFLFLGPTGVGKTELAKALATAYFGSEKDIVRVDLNQFGGADAESRFLGKKITGKEELEGGDFVKKIKENPFSVVLLDEIEKAEKSVPNLLLQAVDEGYLTDGLGQKVSLSNAIIIATSNAGAERIRESVQKGTSYENLKESVLEHLQKEGTFAPEFLNRFDGLIVFRPLSQMEVRDVASLMFEGIQKDYEEKGYKIELQAGVLEELAQRGYQPELGARTMRRVFQDILETFLADEILKGNVKKGEVFEVTKEALFTKVA